VVPFPHDIFGEGIYAFVTLKEHVKETDEASLVAALKALVKSKIAAYAIPHKFLFAKNLPKTRSGKIMRRILRKIVEEKPEEMGDISTLADPAVVEEILQKYHAQKK
jgi:acetyl-CoA synthetase